MIKRIISALILITLVLFIIFFASVPVFGIISCAIFLYAAYEWARLVGFSKKEKILYLLITFSVFFIAYEINVNEFVIIPISIAWWISSLFLLVRFQRRQGHVRPFHKYVQGAIGILLFLSAWSSLSALLAEEVGRWLILFCLLIVWAADSSAYFIGKRWGKHVFASYISPKKTIEGVIAALTASLLVALAESAFLGIPPWPTFKYVILGVVTGVFCVVGDLYESMMKRMYNVKDSGALIPGHGGLLDRIDGLLAALPFFAAGIYLI